MLYEVITFDLFIVAGLVVDLPLDRNGDGQQDVEHDLNYD